MKGACGKRVILSVKCLTDFCSAPTTSWGNYNIIQSAAESLSRKRPEEQVSLLGSDIDCIMRELKCAPDESVSNVCLKMLDAINTKKMYHTKMRRWFGVIEQMQKLCSKELHHQYLHWPDWRCSDKNLLLDLK